MDVFALRVVHDSVQHMTYSHILGLYINYATVRCIPY